MIGNILCNQIAMIGANVTYESTEMLGITNEAGIVMLIITISCAILFAIK